MGLADRRMLFCTGRVCAAIGAAMWVAACDDAGPAGETDAATAQPAGNAEAPMLATNSEASESSAATAAESPAAKLPPDDAAVLATLFATLADEQRLADGSEWTSGVVGASGTILEAEDVAGTECMRFRSSMDAAEGPLLLVGVACERLGGWAIDELDVEATTG